MDTADLDYPLPADAIAQVPVEPRDAARLLVDEGPDRAPSHQRVADLPDLLLPGDLLVVNDTRVRPARLHLRKPTGGHVEVLLLEAHGDGRWEALVRPSRKVPPGTALRSEAGDLSVEVGEDLGEGLRAVTLDGDPSAAGEVPLPPYIHTALADPERYQTVYARRPLSAAAPTAGLHLTEQVLERCRANGVTVASLELAVGLDTFKPLAVEHLDDHVMHSEAFAVPADVMAAVEAAPRVVAIGTTVVRALESAAATGRLEGRTDLFITPGFDFKAVDVLMTNFHVPRTSLLALIAAFIGPRWRELYALALADGYRFLSFGDAMLLQRQTGAARP
jgi:S-adenosylmethionine:tRNA ribosyltransferase-isomerase